MAEAVDVRQLVTENEALLARCLELEEAVKKEPGAATGELVTLFRNVLGEVRGNGKKSYTINPSQPRFHGKSTENISEWLITMDGNLRYGGVAEEDKVGVATTYLGGAALQAYRRLSRRTGAAVITYRNFSEMLEREFLAAEYESVIVQKLRVLKQDRLSINEYIDTFSLLMNKITSVQPQELFMIGFFVGGLNSDLSTYVKRSNCANLEACIRLVRNVDASHAEVQAEHVVQYVNTERVKNSSDQLSKKETRVCYGCGKAGHISSNCRVKNEKSAVASTSFKSEKQKLKCSFCGKMGHLLSNCFKRKSVHFIQEDVSVADQGNQVNTVSKAQEILPRRQMARMPLSMYSMDDNFEITNNVCVVQDSKAHELMTIPVVMNGISLKALIDSGASHSILSYDVVKTHNLKFVDTKTRVMMGNGSFDYTYGSVVDARVEVMNNSNNLTLWILPNPIQLLLGADWLYLTGATINIRNESLSFPDCTYQKLNQCQFFEETAVDILVDENYQNDCDVVLQVNVGGCKVQCGNFDEVSMEVQQGFSELLMKYADIFAFSYEDVTKQKSLFRHEIHTTTEKPIHSRIYRRSAASKALIDQEVQKMLQAKVIRNSVSPWSSQPCMVKKKDGSLRFTVDYRSLNNITVADPYPIPRIDDIHDTLSNSKWYSTLDMKAGYWQIEMHPDSIAKTAFSTNEGHYEFLRMPFGIKNCLLYTSPSPRDGLLSRMPSSA